MDLKVLGKERIYFLFKGERCSFQVNELEDGFWGIECGHGLFQILNTGSIRLATLVYDALEEIRKLHPDLALSMQDAYFAICKQNIVAFRKYPGDQRRLFQLN